MSQGRDLLLRLLPDLGGGGRSGGVQAPGSLGASVPGALHQPGGHLPCRCAFLEAQILPFAHPGQPPLSQSRFTFNRHLLNLPQ